MKATGIVRRIDDLGRIVIPKEIRRTMRIREGDPLEIFTDREGEVIFKKYSPIGEMLSFASQYAETLYKTSSLPVIISDRDSVVAYAGVSKKECADKKISAELEDIMEQRSMFSHKNGSKQVFVVDGNEKISVSCAMPIVSEGDIIGAVVSLQKEGEEREPDEVEIKLVSTAAAFLSKQLDS